MVHESTVELLSEFPKEALYAIGAFGWGCIGYTVYRVIRGVVKIAKK